MCRNVYRINVQFLFQNCILSLQENGVDSSQPIQVKSRNVDQTAEAITIRVVKKNAEAEVRFYDVQAVICEIPGKEDYHLFE